jgi:hypothetical protein
MIVTSNTSLAYGQTDPLTPRDAVLFYDDYPTRGDPLFQVTQQIATPLVAHIDSRGKPTDWMFDSFIFGSMWLYITHNPSQAYDDAWIKYLFDGGQISNLDITVGAVKSALNQPSYQMKVFIWIPVNSQNVTAASITSNLDKILTRWGQLKPANLRLVGFYWGFTEDFYGVDGVWYPEDVLPGVISYVHSKGLKMLMIPYLEAFGFEGLLALGMDYVTMQPNYAWDKNQTLSDFTQVNNAMKAGYTNGAEFELSRDVRNGETWQVNLNTYFSQAYYYGWQHNSINTYYHGSDISYYGRSTSADCRNAYEMIYKFILSTKGLTPTRRG